ncbi:TRMT1-like protein isoform X2 [Rhodnius prolixus]|uniref:TRMT1-like protein isoform X2 n=1 Tax=Rhodnius prolixus TaxID=13249 RepID=UPI003D18E3FE
MEVTNKIDFKDRLRTFQENSIKIRGDNKTSCPRKTPYYFNEDYKFNRLFVSSVLAAYVKSGLSVSSPVKCADVLGACGASGITWKKHLGDSVNVIINDKIEMACDLIKDNIQRNHLQITVSSKDPCIFLHERGYNFVYLDCSNEASLYFDSAFRNIARNGIIVVTTKDDSSLHGGNPEVALRKYSGRIVRCFYAPEMAIRLVIAAMARSAISHNKSIEVLCSTVFKNTFTVAVLCTKSPQVSSKCTENLRLLKHCMVCEERLFYPASDGFPVDPKNIQLDCECSKNAPGKTAQELGPLWAGPIFNADFIQEMLANKFGSDNVLKSTLSIILEEARCVSKEDDAIGGKRLKIILEPCPPFYYNLHKHHPKIPQQLKLNRVIDELRNKGFRKRRTNHKQDSLTL